jgi:hypothetical protein
MKILDDLFIVLSLALDAVNRMEDRAQAARCDAAAARLLTFMDRLFARRAARAALRARLLSRPKCLR